MQLVEIEGRKTGRKKTRRLLISRKFVEKFTYYQLAIINPQEKCFFIKTIAAEC